MHEPGPGHLDLFSGIGGFALAAGWAGFSTIAFSEIDPYASAVLAKHWPGVPNFGDIRSLDGRGFCGVSLLTAGVPCQPASCAGQQRGSADDRWLWPEALRILGEARPTFAVFENPPGILALSGGLEFERLLLAMEGYGYSVQPIIVPACAVDARHRRDRIWIVAHAEEPGARSNNGRVRTRLGRIDGGQKAETVPDESEAISDAGHRGPRTTGSQWPKPDPSDSFSGCRWISEAQSGVRRVSDGVPYRAHRLRGLGNAIVPQVAFQILREIRKLI